MLTFWGPWLFVDIGFDQNFKVGAGIPVPGKTGLPALIDTGAWESCIDSLLAAQLNLPVVDRRMVAGAHGAKEVNMHLAQIHVQALKYTIYGQFAGVDLRAGGQSIDALIGRTFLRRFRMIYDGTTGDVELIEP
ncbi:MAG TPA: aspartyl protease family protein [Terracidiphilus sp.]|nr:aspartyl protease family protein [Terracidiphilus sp.]